MKKFVIIATGIFLTVCAVFIYTIVPDHGPLYDTVEIDFRTKYPDYELVDCRTGDADMVVAYVHIKYRKPEDNIIEEEVWQYWDTENGWLHRDEYLNVMEQRK